MAHTLDTAYHSRTPPSAYSLRNTFNNNLKVLLNQTVKLFQEITLDTFSL